MHSSGGPASDPASITGPGPESPFRLGPLQIAHFVRRYLRLRWTSSSALASDSNEVCNDDDDASDEDSFPLPHFSASIIASMGVLGVEEPSNSYSVQRFFAAALCSSPEVGTGLSDKFSKERRHLFGSNDGISLGLDGPNGSRMSIPCVRGLEDEVRIESLRVGDVIRVVTGDTVPVDGLILRRIATPFSTHEIEDPFAESRGVELVVRKRRAGDMLVLAGSRVREGEAFVLVIATGQNTVWVSRNQGKKCIVM